MYDVKQSLLSYRIAPNGNRKCVGRSNISVSIVLQNVMDRYGTGQKAIRYNGNIVLLNSSKSAGRDTSTNFLNECEFTFSVLTDCINKSFEAGTFPDCLKKPNVTRIFKKADPLNKENYRRVCKLQFKNL